MVGLESVDLSLVLGKNIGRLNLIEFTDQVFIWCRSKERNRDGARALRSQFSKKPFRPVVKKKTDGFPPDLSLTPSIPEPCVWYNENRRPSLMVCHMPQAFSRMAVFFAPNRSACL
jgi:hypothetical protein